MRDSGKSVPILDRQPDIEPDVLQIWQAFLELRSMQNESTARIPVSEILAWMQMRGIDDLDMRDYLFEIIGDLDSVWVEHKRKEAKAEQERIRKQNARPHH